VESLINDVYNLIISMEMVIKTRGDFMTAPICSDIMVNIQKKQKRFFKCYVLTVIGKSDTKKRKSSDKGGEN